MEIEGIAEGDGLVMKDWILGLESLRCQYSRTDVAKADSSLGFREKF